MNKSILGTLSQCGRGAWRWLNVKPRMLVAKYLLAGALLAFVVWLNWGHPDAPEATPALGASTIGLAASPLGPGPLLAAAAVTPGRVHPDDRGLGYVWQHHVLQRQPINFGALSLAFVFLAVALPITYVRWWVLVRAQDLDFSVGAAFRLGTIGLFFSTFLPGSVGGDLVKAAGIAREQSRRTVAVATVVMDRLVGLWGLFWLVALIGGGFWMSGGLEGSAVGPSKLIVGVSLAVVALSLTVWFALGLLSDARATALADRLARLPKVGGSVAELWRAVWMYRKRQASVFFALFLSLIGFLGFIPAFYYSSVTLGEAGAGLVPTLLQNFLFVPIGFVVQAVVPLPGGIGAGEYGFGKLFQWFGCPEPNGVLSSLVYRVVTLALSLLGYLVVAGMGGSGRTVTSGSTPELPAVTDEPWARADSVIAADAAATQ
ncbi:MAG TPA: lysylphosphatidylglycerol synthase transmembrane domain-containing protein [Gemmataceae bacterium]|nr:lysylphosphatidylglycerol synthase transmembrane domain-containing protein [Gemmataceae bacterium]